MLHGCGYEMANIREISTNSIDTPRYIIKKFPTHKVKLAAILQRPKQETNWESISNYIS